MGAVRLQELSLGASQGPTRSLALKGLLGEPGGRPAPAALRVCLDRVGGEGPAGPAYLWAGVCWPLARGDGSTGAAGLPRACTWVRAGCRRDRGPPRPPTSPPHPSQGVSAAEAAACASSVGLRASRSVAASAEWTAEQPWVWYGPRGMCASRVRVGEDTHLAGLDGVRSGAASYCCGEEAERRWPGTLEDKGLPLDRPENIPEVWLQEQRRHNGSYFQRMLITVLRWWLGLASVPLFPPVKSWLAVAGEPRPQCPPPGAGKPQGSRQPRRTCRTPQGRCHSLTLVRSLQGSWSRLGGAEESLRRGPPPV